MPRVDLMGWALMLIALALGYGVLIKANKEQVKGLKILGMAIGGIILVAILVLSVSGIIDLIKGGKRARPGTRRTTTMPRTTQTMPQLPKLPPNLPRAPAMPKAPAAPEQAQ